MDVNCHHNFSINVQFIRNLNEHDNKKKSIETYTTREINCKKS